jgi:hypothetical protein
VFKLFQYFHSGSNDCVEAKHAHALRNILRIVTTLKRVLCFFDFRHQATPARKPPWKCLGTIELHTTPNQGVVNGTLDPREDFGRHSRVVGVTDLEYEVVGATDEGLDLITNNILILLKVGNGGFVKV